MVEVGLKLRHTILKLNIQNFARQIFCYFEILNFPVSYYSCNIMMSYKTRVMA